MEIANGIISPTPEFQHMTYGITPAEALIIKEMHNAYSNGSPLKNLVVVGEAGEVDQYGKPVVIPTTRTTTQKVEQNLKGKIIKHDAEAEETTYSPSTKARTNAEECDRLRRKYTGNINKGGQTLHAFVATFGTASVVSLPQTFEEIKDIIGPVFTYAEGYKRKETAAAA